MTIQEAIEDLLEKQAAFIVAKQRVDAMVSDSQSVAAAFLPARSESEPTAEQIADDARRFQQEQRAKTDWQPRRTKPADTRFSKEAQEALDKARTHGEEIEDDDADKPLPSQREKFHDEPGDSVRDRVVSLVNGAPQKFFTTSEICKSIGSSAQTTYAALSLLVKQGAIHRPKHGVYQAGAGH
jgi:hypothetical protein